MTLEIPVDEQFGTYWWHSHSSEHYQDGLRAPFIIHGQNESHTYDEDITIIISDWYHDRAGKLNKQFMNKFNPTGAEPIPDALLIYAYNSTSGAYLPSKNASEAVGFNENLNIPFVPGKTYRLRFLNPGIFSMWFAWIEGHDMRVIEVDGVETEEYPVDYLTLSVAQRYSVLVTARNDTSSNFKLSAKFDETMFDTIPDGLQLNYTTNIIYDEASPMADVTTKDELGLMTDYLMTPVTTVGQYTPNKELELDVWFDAYDNGVNRASMYNNITYVSPKVPSLNSMISMGDDALLPSIYGKQTAAQVLDANDIMRVTIINFDANAHPFHLHGHNFQVTRVSTDVTSDDPEINPPRDTLAANPMRRDTVIVPAGGAVDLIFLADNPGAWIFHCHIQWHMEAGLAVVFMEDPLGAQKTLSLPQDVQDQCTAQGISVTGNAVGKMSATDLSGQADGPRDQAYLTGWTTKAKGAMAGCVLTALIGMLSVVWYAVGGQLDADELEEEVHRDMAKKEAAGGGYLKRGFKAVAGRK
ncbi:hypothetical protein JCM8547_004024 [Rhodosporidiobolus lusitaniae]